MQEQEIDILQQSIEALPTISSELVERVKKRLAERSPLLVPLNEPLPRDQFSNKPHKEMFFNAHFQNGKADSFFSEFFLRQQVKIPSIGRNFDACAYNFFYELRDLFHLDEESLQRIPLVKIHLFVERCIAFMKQIEGNIAPLFFKGENAGKDFQDNYINNNDIASELLGTIIAEEFRALLQKIPKVQRKTESAVSTKVSTLFSEEEVAELRQKFLSIANEHIPRKSEEPYPEQTITKETEIELSVPGQIDTNMHAQTGDLHGITTHGNLLLIDALTGQAFTVFKGGTAEHAQNIIKPHTVESLEARVRAVHLFKTKPELRDKLWENLLEKCTIGFRIKLASTDPYTHLKLGVLSDLSKTSIEAFQPETLYRSLHMNIPLLRESMNELQTILSQLSEAEKNPYVESLQQKLQVFLSSTFFTRMSEFEERYKKEYIDMACAQVQLFLDGRIGEEDTSWFIEGRVVVNEIKQGNIGEIDNRAIRKEVENLTKRFLFTSSSSFNICGEFTGNTISKNSLGAAIYAQAAMNVKEFKALEEVLEEVAFLIDYSLLGEQLPDSLFSKDQSTHSATSGIKLQGGLHTYGTLRSTLGGGMPLGELTMKELQAPTVVTSATEHYRGHRADFQAARKSSAQFQEHLSRACTHQKGVSLELTRSKPFAVIVGANGSGKSYALETVLQKLGMSQGLGVNGFSEMSSETRLATIRALINASRHQQGISSFQAESDLLKNVLTELEVNETLEHALLAFDEVGKGTDSRDAVSLMFAVLEYARRHNTYISLTTHYGQLLCELANVFGIRDLIQLYVPDPDTHELKPVESIEASNGIEVMEKEGLKMQIPEEVLSKLTANAKRVREAHNTTEHITLNENAPQSDKTKNMEFALPLDMADIGFVARQGVELFGTSSYTFQALSGIVSESIRFSKNRAGAVFDDITRASQSWGDEHVGRDFVAGMTMFDIPVSMKKERKRDIKNLVDTCRNKKDLASTMMLDLREVYTGITILSQVDIKREETAKYIQKYGWTYDSIKQVSNIPTIDHGLQSSIEPFIEQFGNIYRRKQFFNTVRRVKTYYPASIADGFDVLLEKEKEFESLFAQDEKRRNEFYALACKDGTIIREVREFLSRYKTLDDKMWVSLFAEYGVELGAGYWRQEIVKHIETETPLGNGTYLDAFLQAFGGNKKMLDDFPRSLRDLITVRQHLSYRSWIAYQRALSEKPLVEVNTPSHDYYSYLGVNRNSTAEEITSAFRTKSKLHPDSALPLAYDRVLEIPSSIDSKERARLIEAAKRKVSWSDLEKQIVIEKNKLLAELPDSRLLNEAKEVLLDPVKRAAYDEHYLEYCMRECAFRSTLVHSILARNMVEPVLSADGSVKIRSASNVGLKDALKFKKLEEVKQSLEIDGAVDAVVIGGRNGEGKSQLLTLLATLFVFKEAAGFIPAEYAELSECNFIISAINAGDSRIGSSSFQTEIRRYLDVIKRYVDAGCPENGILFLDEPLASTSSEDQTGILIAIIDFFKSHGVKVVFTNHNHALYDLLSRVHSADGLQINFLPVAYTGGAESKYKLTYFKQDETEKIQSGGIDVAEERGVPKGVIRLAKYIRTVIDEMNRRKKVATA